jgi:putative spermidine/putrescine transport system ATP-binding protein
VLFGSRVGLRDVSLQVRSGERVALLGPSGTGKTSLLRAIAGLGGLSSGSIRVDGREVGSDPPERRGIVYMHQVPALFPHLTVLDNVAFPREVRGTPRREARRLAADLLHRVQLAELADRAPATLSGGQRHRAALARALAAKPAVLLLDEPFAALDPALRADVRDAVVKLLTEDTGPAVIVVTHDVDEAATLAGRLVVLLDGRLAQSGPPSELLAAPRSLAIARFLGLPNLIRGVRDDNGRIASALGTFRAAGPPGNVTLAVRASAIRLRPWRGHGPRATIVGVVERVSGALARVSIDGEELLGVPDVELDLTLGIAAVDVDTTVIHVIEEPQQGS